MGSVKLWSASCFRWRDLPTLQELFSSCDRALLEQVVIEDFACRGKRIDKKRYAAMQSRLATSLDVMESLTLARKSSKSWLLAPQGSYLLHAQKRSISWRLHMALVPRCHSATLKRFIQNEKDLVAPCSQVNKTKKQRSRTAACFRGHMRDGQLEALGVRNYTLVPWEETLACRVWLGGDWCCRERYVALASAFWEMTFFGFEYERAQTRMVQEKAACATESSEVSVRSRSFKSRLEKSSDVYGLRPPNLFVQKDQRRMAQRVAVLNSNENLTFYERLLDLSQRLERNG